MNQEEEILDCTCGTRSMTVSGSGYAVLDKSGNVIYSSRGSVCDETCRGCVFRGSTGVTITCDHILIAGRRRGCPAGAGCTRRIEGTARSMSIDARTFRLAPGAAAPPPEAAGASVLPKRAASPSAGDGGSLGLRPSGGGDLSTASRSPSPFRGGKDAPMTEKELEARERRRALDRARYYRDREKYLARAKARNKNLSEEQKRKKAEQSRQWRAKNREHANEYQRQRRKAETEEQRERRLAANREWMQTHKEQRNAWYREYRKKKAAEKEKNE